jgi:capsular exopolysaccharide synthesis family protein
MRTQIGILTSPWLARAVVTALHLTQNPEFSPGRGGATSSVVTRLQKLGLVPVRADAPRPNDKIAIAADILADKMIFSNDAQSFILGIAATTGNPGVSAAIANEVVKQFLDFKIDEKFTAMERARDWLQGQVASLGIQVHDDDQAVETYRLSHGLSEETPDDIGDGTIGPQAQTVNRQQLDAMSAELVQVASDLSLREGALAQARAAATGSIPRADLPAVLDSPVIAQMLDDTSLASSDAASLATSEGANNLSLRSTRARLTTLQAQTQGVMASIARSLGVEVAAEVLEQQQLLKRQEALRKAVIAENEAELGLSSLETRARTTRNIYESFLARAAELGNVAGIQEADASLVSSAQPPLSASGPQATRLIAIAGVLSLVLSTGLAFVRERVRGGFSLPQQIEAAAGLPIIALMPKLRHARFQRDRSGRAETAMAASLDRLRGQMHSFVQDGKQLLMVTSALPKEGKSFFAAELACNLAAAGWRVMVLDCDLEHRSMAGYFGLSPSADQRETPANPAFGADAAAILSATRNLDVMMAGPGRHGSNDVLGSEPMMALLADLRQRYDVVIIDVPPILRVVDTILLGQKVDATLAVVQWEKTPRKDVIAMAKVLRRSRVPVMGLVMNRVDLRKVSVSSGNIWLALKRYNPEQA